jgi:hypothetical protein
MSIIKAKDFKPENISFSAPKPNKHGGKIVYINYNYDNDSGPRPLRIQFEKSKVPFGISGWSQSASDKKSGEPTLTSNDTLEISFNDKNTELIEKLQEVEELAIKLAADNSKEFFKKKYTLNELRLFYKTSILLDSRPRCLRALKGNMSQNFTVNTMNALNLTWVIVLQSSQRDQKPSVS